ncbi:MAG: hypothetical protein AB7C96_11890 [Hydrogenovibrio sp.]|jgi:hypothetical protein
MDKKSSQGIVESFDADVLEQLRVRAQAYKKLNFAYAAAGGAIITALNLSENEFFEFTASIWFIATAFILLLVVDTEIEDFLLNDWIAAKEKAEKRYAKSTVKTVLGTQRLLHLLFISSIVLGTVSYSHGILDGQQYVFEKFNARANIQQVTDKYLLAEEHIPESIEELKSFDPSIERSISKLDGEPIKIESENFQYKIIFSGEDKIFDTDDDIILIPEVKLKDILKKNN